MTAFKNTHPPRGRLTVSTVPAPGASPGTEPAHTGKPRTVGEDPCLLWMFSPPGSGVTFSVYYPEPGQTRKNVRTPDTIRLSIALEETQSAAARPDGAVRAVGVGSTSGDFEYCQGDP
jgi:hypothetical protein